MWSNGVLDSRFGRQGEALIGGITPSVVVTDARGNHYVVGHTLEQAPAPAVQRFFPNGILDTTFGVGGTSVGAPVTGAQARHAVPLGDGRLLIFGEVERLNAQAAIWLVQADGRFAPEWLLMSGTNSSRVLNLERGSDESVVLGLLVGADRGVTLEAHVVVAGREGAQMPETLARQPLPKGWSRPVLQKRAKGWFWALPDEPEKTAVRLSGVESDEPSPWTWRSLASPPLPEEVRPVVSEAPSATSENAGAAFNPLAQERPAQLVSPEQNPWYERFIWDLALLAVGVGAVCTLLCLWRRNSYAA